MVDDYENLRKVVNGLLEYKEEEETLKAPAQKELAEFMGYSDTSISKWANGNYNQAVRAAGMVPRSERVPGDYLEAFHQLEPGERKRARDFEENALTGKFYSGESQLTYNQAREKSGLTPRPNCTGSL